MQEMFGSFRLPNDLSLVAKECGMANAWYQRPKVTICYEYVDDIDKGVRKETRDGITHSDGVLGQFIYTVAHEMGHALFDTLNVPLLGRPEDAADEFATYMMLSFGKQDARRLIHGAAYGYKDYLRNLKVTVPLHAFSDAHGAPMQRFYNLLCIAYGADQETFGDLADHQHLTETRALFQGHLPEGRARGCRIEFGELNFAFQHLIKPHMDQQLAKAVLQDGWLPDVLAEPDAPPEPPLKE
jgi:Putative metallopeptidase